MKIKKLAAKKKLAATEVMVKRHIDVVLIGGRSADSAKARVRGTMSSKMETRKNSKKSRKGILYSLKPAFGGLRIGAWTRCSTHGLQYPRGESCPKCP